VVVLLQFAVAQPIVTTVLPDVIPMAKVVKEERK
jgi:hypothetical protein